MTATSEYTRKNGTAALNRQATISVLLKGTDQAIEKFTELKRRIEALERAVGVDTSGVERSFSTTRKKSK